MFKLGHAYTKADIYLMLGVPAFQQGGNWNTGYHSYKGDWYFFCNIGVPGRTAHDYPNYFLGDAFISHAKRGIKEESNSIKELKSEQSKKYIFYREDNLSGWIFVGLGVLERIEPGAPLKFIWGFNSVGESRPERVVGEILPSELFHEGAVKKVLVNNYERNPCARKKCLDHYGVDCVVCGFNFEKTWGAIGRGYIHVHHLKELSEIGERYLLDPINDLRPVCANCHAMLHKRRPAYSINELKEMLIEKSYVEPEA